MGSSSTSYVDREPQTQGLYSATYPNSIPKGTADMRHEHSQTSRQRSGYINSFGFGLGATLTPNLTQAGTPTQQGAAQTQLTSPIQPLGFPTSPSSSSSPSTYTYPYGHKRQRLPSSSSNVAEYRPHDLPSGGTSHTYAHTAQSNGLHHQVRHAATMYMDVDPHGHGHRSLAALGGAAGVAGAGAGAGNRSPSSSFSDGHGGIGHGFRTGLRAGNTYIYPPSSEIKQGSGYPARYSSGGSQLSLSPSTSTSISMPPPMSSPYNRTASSSGLHHPYPYQNHNQNHNQNQSEVSASVAGGKVGGAGGSATARTSVGSATATATGTGTATATSWSIVVDQQPERARLCSFKEENDTIDRRPVDPPPIVRIITNSSSASSFPESNQLFVKVNLVSNVPSTDPSTFPPYHNPLIPFYPEVKLSQGTAATTGEALQTPEKLVDLEGKEGMFCVFGKLSIRMPGVFRLNFVVYQTIDDGVEEVTSCISEPFEVFSPKLFTGMKPSTTLTRHFASQGCKVKLRQSGGYGAGPRKRKVEGGRQQQQSANSSSTKVQKRNSPLHRQERFTTSARADDMMTSPISGRAPYLNSADDQSHQQTNLNSNLMPSPRRQPSSLSNGDSPLAPPSALSDLPPPSTNSSNNHQQQISLPPIAAAVEQSSVSFRNAGLVSFEQSSSSSASYLSATAKAPPVAVDQGGREYRDGIRYGGDDGSMPPMSFGKLPKMIYDGILPSTPGPTMFSPTDLSGFSLKMTSNSLTPGGGGASHLFASGGSGGGIRTTEASPKSSMVPSRFSLPNSNNTTSGNNTTASDGHSPLFSALHRRDTDESASSSEARSHVIATPAIMDRMSFSSDGDKGRPPRTDSWDSQSHSQSRSQSQSQSYYQTRKQEDKKDFTPSNGVGNIRRFSSELTSRNLALNDEKAFDLQIPQRKSRGNGTDYHRTDYHPMSKEKRQGMMESNFALGLGNANDAEHPIEQYDNDRMEIDVEKMESMEHA